MSAPAPAVSDFASADLDASASAAGSEVRRRIDEAPLSSGQILVVALLVLMAVADGYDLLAIALVAPVVSHDWGIAKAALGIVLAAGLIGMAAGSLVISPLADTRGRKPIVVAGLILTSAGTILSAFTHTPLQLGACRLITGIGIGTMGPLITTMAAEFANARRRGFVVSLSTLGQPLGGLICGITAATVLRHHSWTWIFLLGGVGTAAMIPLVIMALPESPSFLISRRPAGALDRLNHVLVRFGQPPTPKLPLQPVIARTSYRALFTSGLAAVTLRLTLINVLVIMAAYYVISWLPQLVADAGFAPSTAGLVSVVVSVVGIPGGVLMGALSAGAGPNRLAAIAMIGFGIAIAALGFAPPVLSIILLCSGACGFFLSGSLGVFYAAVADSFTPLTRASGVGFVSGVARAFSALGPALAGIMFQVGATRGQVSLLFAVAVILAGLLFAKRPPIRQLETRAAS